MFKKRLSNLEWALMLLASFASIFSFFWNVLIFRTEGLDRATKWTGLYALWPLFVAVALNGAMFITFAFQKKWNMLFVSIQSLAISSLTVVAHIIYMQLGTNLQTIVYITIIALFALMVIQLAIIRAAPDNKLVKKSLQAR